MPQTPEPPSLDVTLTLATRGQQPILANLLEFYAHDFSEFHPLQLGADGRFGYPHLSAYWSQPDHYPFLINVDGNLAGLALIKKTPSIIHSGEVWDVAEFFIIRAYRRRGIGNAVAREVWKKFPGRWEVRVMESNRTGAEFWSRAIPAFVGGSFVPVAFEKEGERWLVFAFESAAVV